MYVLSQEKKRITKFAINLKVITTITISYPQTITISFFQTKTQAAWKLPKENLIAMKVATKIKAEVVNTSDNILGTQIPSMENYIHIHSHHHLFDQPPPHFGALRRILRANYRPNNLRHHLLHLLIVCVWAFFTRSFNSLLSLWCDCRWGWSFKIVLCALDIYNSVNHTRSIVEAINRQQRLFL